MTLVKHYFERKITVNLVESFDFQLEIKLPDVNFGFRHGLMV